MLEHNISNTTSDILTLNRKKIRPGVYLVLFEIIRSKFDEKRFYVAVINRKNDSVVEASIDSSFGLLMRHGVNPENVASVALPMTKEMADGHFCMYLDTIKQ